MLFLSFRAQAYALILIAVLDGLHKINAKAFASDSEAGLKIGEYLTQAHTLLQLAARHADRATPDHKTPVLRSAGGPKQKKGLN